jgi:hypothetical protein
MKLFPEPTLDPGESIRTSWGANRGDVGGRLYLTNRRLTFEPHVVDAAFGCKRSSIPLSRITGVGLQPGVLSVAHLLDGGLFTRLRIEASHDYDESFFVQRVADVQQVVAQAVQSSETDRNP